VQYRVVARYEVGERDAVIAEGTIPARSRGGITVSEYANPGSAVVRLNEGYALEIQSTAYIGAHAQPLRLLHGPAEHGRGGGRVVHHETSRECSSRRVERQRRLHPLLQPLRRAAEISVSRSTTRRARPRLCPGASAVCAAPASPSATPRWASPPGNHFGVFITSTDNQQFVASISSYSTTSEIGYSSLGQQLA